MVSGDRMVMMHALFVVFFIMTWLRKPGNVRRYREKRGTAKTVTSGNRRTDANDIPM